MMCPSNSYQNHGMKLPVSTQCVMAFAHCVLNRRPTHLALRENLLDFGSGRARRPPELLLADYCHFSNLLSYHFLMGLFIQKQDFC